MTDRVVKYRYSEIFGKTFQGEGTYTGVPTVWLRSWGCNFNCSLFGTSHDDIEAIERGEKPSVEVPSLAELDLSQYKTMEELPVFKFGCDSSYSWSKSFAHLARQDTAEDIATQIVDLNKHSSNPEGRFIHPVSGQSIHMAFTGGEPMMSQSAIVDVMKSFDSFNNTPKNITIETNGSQSLRKPFVEYFSEYLNRPEENELFWSVSPKLYLSGEQWDQAVQPDVVAEYAELSDDGQLKYVVNGTDRSWREVEEATRLYREAGVYWPVWIMPVGATKDQQQEPQIANIAEEAVLRGYNVAARVHCYVFGNIIGK